MAVEIKQMPELRLATLRHTGPYNQIGEAFERLSRQLGPAAGPLFQLGAQMIALYHDDPEAVPTAELRSDAAISIPAGADMPQGLVEQRIPSGRYAAALHVGGYDRLGDAWARFMGEWLPASGERATPGVCFELYLNDPSTTPKDQLRTEMYAPLE